MNDTAMEILKERIQERMTALGKNPSSVALDAGLSRSTVRDILSGKAKNPGIVTVNLIADALECSHNYLLGNSDSLHYREAKDVLIDAFARTSDISGTLEAGVFRQIPLNDPKSAESHVIFGYRQRKPLRAHRRYTHRDLYLYRAGDDSLAGKNIIKGDLLMAVFDPENDPLPDKSLVIVAHRLQGAPVEELSARLVKKAAKGLSLVSAPNDIDGARYSDIEVAEPLADYGRFKTKEGGTIFIEGAVVELTRQLDV